MSSEKKPWEKMLKDFVDECIERSYQQVEEELKLAVIQALKSGDFQQYVATGYEPEIVYLPYSGIERLRQENARLLESTMPRPKVLNFEGELEYMSRKECQKMVDQYLVGRKSGMVEPDGTRLVADVEEVEG